jgi:hypothetical protein
MKRFNIFSVAFALSLVFLVSCAEKDRTFPEFAEIEHGAFARLLGKVTGPYLGDFNLTDVDGSFVEYEVEFYDDTQGKGVQEYSWVATHSKSGQKAEVVKVTSDKFVVNANGLPGTKIKLTMNEILAKLGLTKEAVGPGERFTFAGTIVHNGKAITQANSSASLELPAFANLLRFNVNLVCPSDLGGKYAYKTKGWCGTEVEGEVNMKEETKNGEYQWFLNGATDPDFSLGAYGACYSATATLPGGDLRLVDVCNTLSYIGKSRWGETYFFNTVTVDGADLILDWKNDYDPEAGVTTFTRTTGSWPALKK